MSSQGGTPSIQSCQSGKLTSENRYYADAVLGCLHRVMAIREWSKLKDMQDISLERALVAFDMFVLHERNGDSDQVRSIQSLCVQITDVTDYYTS